MPLNSMIDEFLRNFRQVFVIGGKCHVKQRQTPNFYKPVRVETLIRSVNRHI